LSRGNRCKKLLVKCWWNWQAGCQFHQHIMSSFFVLTVWIWIFWRKEIDAKASCQMLVKSTNWLSTFNSFDAKSHSSNVSYKHHFQEENKLRTSRKKRTMEEIFSKCFQIVGSEQKCIRLYYYFLSCLRNEGIAFVCLPCAIQFLEHDIQSNLVITNSMGPPLSVRYNREIVITVKIYVVKKPDGTKNVCNFCSL